MLSLDKQWVDSPLTVALAPAEVHIWYSSLEHSTRGIAHLSRLLSQEERVRAAQFHFEQGRKHFTVGRGKLRTLLGRYLAIPPEQVQFAYEAHGKPYLREPQHKIHFNVSHSHGVALYAFVLDHAIGVDLERIQTLPNMVSIVDRFFSVQEQKSFHALPADQQTAAFFGAWTRKEAYLKACGDGLSTPLSQFEVTFAPGDATKIITIAGSTHGINEWSLQDITLSSEYKAAFVVKGKEQWVVRHWVSG